ncbi:unnamed protein product [Didymodactylos carnosus]|uniref:G-protein coupled receptors family 1 profile domain-containing protein n=1 Tax=Didymodactylos carnosus TaxID=1234261 RepID=A0A8S2M3V8_9BILA|nr:unnamed protein product [Didymodactylos carnosus]CAF3922222.1 unnamed protein product [Didymodactylos carnosus]
MLSEIQIPSILTLIFNIFIIKNSFIKPLNNEKLKSRSKSRTRRVTTMLLASNIGFLALVSPAQIFYALTFDPHSIKSQDKYFFSYMIKAQIYQCLINTYYAMNFVFCFASSSFFRREIQKFINSSDLRRKSETSSANNIITNKKFYNNDKVMETTTMLGENKSCMVDDTTVVTD